MQRAVRTELPHRLPMSPLPVVCRMPLYGANRGNGVLFPIATITDTKATDRVALFSF